MELQVEPEETDDRDARMIETMVRRTVKLDAPAREVWRLLTERAERERWFGADIDVVLAPGAVGTAVDEDGSLREIVVEVVEHGRRLGFTWWPTGDPDAASTVTITLTFDGDGDGDGTTLTVVEAPVARSGGRMCNAMEAGDPWADRLLGLELAVLSRVGVAV